MPDPTSRFLRACRGLRVDRTPIWVMRQAGRYLPEYRKIREQTTFLGLCKTPELAAEVTVQPVRRFGVDAAIIFSDILIPAEAMGMELVFDEGPHLVSPIRSQADVDKLRVPDPHESMRFVADAIRLVVREIPTTPTIGFCGAPFTIASYMIEGGSSRDFQRTKRFMVEEPRTWRALCQKLVQTLVPALLAQIEAGASAIQIFDSWAGNLSPDDYLSFALPYVVEILDGLRGSDVPRIVFARGVHDAWGELSRMGADVLSVDWTSRLDRVALLCEGRVSLQGNLDPVVLLGPIERIARQVQRVLNEAKGARGHIFNLGHGILPDTPPEHMAALVEIVHREGVTRTPDASTT